MKVHMVMTGINAPMSNPIVCIWNDNNTLKATHDPKKVTCLRCLSRMEQSYRVFGKYAELFEKDDDETEQG